VLLLNFLIIACLWMVFAQDIRFRAVSWFFFPALAILYVSRGLAAGIYVKELLLNSALNLGFLLLVFALVWLYISLRHRRLIRLPDRLIGWGDILFLLCICFYFTLLNFILFYITSLFLVIIFWLVWTRYKPQAAKRHIPLAGLQALILSIFLMVDWLSRSIDLTNDNWLLFLIGG
jgi:hypothetical protein